MLELHCHTTYSDGQLTPGELVKTAANAGVQALAITDHDTLAGWQEAFQAAQNLPLEIIPGIELSTTWGDRSLHILGFYPNPDQIQGPLSDRLAGRKRRAQEILTRLAQLGYPLTLPELEAGMAPGRPHIAAAMVRAGYTKTPQEAFDRFLGDDQPAYVCYERFSATEGIALLRSCGAVPVWAHPFLFRGGDPETVLKVLVEAGLQGLEVYHPSHAPNQVKKLEAWCEQYNLLKTGGSDYHNPEYDTLNYLHLPLSLLAPLKQAAGKN